MLDCSRLIKNLLCFALGLAVPLLLVPFAYADWDNTNAPRYYSTDFDSSWTSTTVGDIYAGYKGGCVAYEYSPGMWRIKVFWDSEPRISYGSMSKAINGDNYDISCGYYSAVSHYRLYYRPRSGDISPLDTRNPPLLVPPEFSNGVKDENEDGIDCGGDNPTVCLDACPSGMVQRKMADTPEGFGYYCAFVSDPNALGQCPKGKIINVSGTECHDVNIASVIKASQEFLDSNPPSTDAVPSPDFPGGSEVESSLDLSAETVVDNGDGTETASLTAEWTNPDGSAGSSTATVQRPANSSPGTGFDVSGGSGSGSGPVGLSPGFVGSVSGTGITSGDENPENFNASGSVPDGDFDGALGDGDVPEKISLTGLISSGIAQLPIVQAFNSVALSTDGGSCSVYVGVVYDTELTIDFCRWEPILRTAGALSVGLAQLFAPFMVFFGLGRSKS